MKMSVMRVLVTGALVSGGLLNIAAAQEATGAGASFPAPLYSKWAADYNKALSNPWPVELLADGPHRRE